MYKFSTRRRDNRWWTLFVLCLASSISFLSALYYYSHHEILLYNDVYEHMIIPRRVVDNITPGLEQLGAGWLPLQHLLILPFIWNDTLWYTGIAGMIPSMVSYVIAALYLFATLQKLTRQIIPGLIGVAIFLFNPNIIYLQAVPLTEVLCAASCAATIYYLLRWFEYHAQKDLVATALVVCLGTLIRYDGWALFLVVSGSIIAVSLFKKEHIPMFLDQVAIYLSIAPLGILFWLFWNIKLSGDPLYFQHGPYSAEAQQLYFLHKGELPGYHNILASFSLYIADIGQTVGWSMLIYALACLILILIVYRKRRECFLLAVLLVPFIFYVLSLYMGQSIIEIPGIIGGKYFFNVRYGAQMVLPVAFFIAWAYALISSWLQHWPIKTIFTFIYLVGIGAQIIGINTTSILSLQDGLVGISCNNPEEPVILSLSQHYNGGYILADEYTSVINPQLFGAHFANIIWEGSGIYWKEALAQPEKKVSWVILNPTNRSDTVSALLVRQRDTFLSSFRLVTSNPNGLQLYYRIGAPPLPTRPVPADLLSRPHTCKLNE